MLTRAGSVEGGSRRLDLHASASAQRSMHSMGCPSSLFVIFRSSEFRKPLRISGEMSIVQMGYPFTDWGSCWEGDTSHDLNAWRCAWQSLQQGHSMFCFIRLTDPKMIQNESITESLTESQSGCNLFQFFPTLFHFFSFQPGLLAYHHWEHGKTWADGIPSSHPTHHSSTIGIPQSFKKWMVFLRSLWFFLWKIMENHGKSING